MNMKSVEDVFIHLLSDTYSAEKAAYPSVKQTCPRRLQREAERRLYRTP
jgi:ferritin-like metal-binding protein YciE